MSNVVRSSYAMFLVALIISSTYTYLYHYIIQVTRSQHDQKYQIHLLGSRLTAVSWQEEPLRNLIEWTISDEFNLKKQ